MLMKGGLIMKKTVSVIILMGMLISLFVPVAAAAERTYQDIPLVLLAGTSNTGIYNEAGEKIMPDNDEKTNEVLSDKKLMAELVASFGIALATDKWDSYTDKLCTALDPIWAEQRCDKNGVASDKTHLGWSWSKKTLSKKKSDFGVNDFRFNYDWRIDPFIVADELHEYIKAVLEVTGKPQVGLIGRCYGSCVTSAYLEKYGDENLVDTALFYCPMVKGVETVDALFTGSIKLDGATVSTYLDYYLTQEKPIDDTGLTDFIVNLLAILNTYGVMDFTATGLTSFVNVFIDKIFPRILRMSYAQDPGYWAMVSDERYEEAKEYVFGGCEEEYAALIEKIDNYHYSVQTPLYDIVDSLIEKNDMNICVIAKYGIPTYPFFEGSDYQTDSSNSVSRMSLGATASTINTVLPDEYIENAVSLGTDKYISSDRKIDASTCYYKDSTWFFKDVGHMEYPAFIDGLMVYATRCTDQLTVWNDPGTVQFMARDAAGVFAEVSGNDPSDLKWEKRDPIKSAIAMLEYIVKLLVENVTKLFNK